VTNPPGGRGVTSLPVRRLTAADLPACSALAVDRDWEPTPDRWRLLYELGEIYGVDDVGGGLAGAVALTRYGPELTAIGKMLVARRHGRQGLGGRLMRHAMDQAGDTVICLLATEYGRPLYERLGFRAIDRSVRYIGPLAPGDPDPAQAGQAAPRDVSAADLPGIAELDRRSFGADRGALLSALPRLADQFVVSDGPAVRGFGAAWRSADTLTIGPVVAGELAVATTLIDSLAAGSDLPVRIEVPGRHPGLASWAAARGLTVRAEATFMVCGGDLPGAREDVYLPASMALC
jgi:GNAT superfamily N-acetyltransferase